MPPRKVGAPLTNADQRRLKALVDRDGVQATAERVGCARGTIYAALGGASIYRTTATAIRAALATAGESLI